MENKIRYLEDESFETAEEAQEFIKENNKKLKSLSFKESYNFICKYQERFIILFAILLHKGAEDLGYIAICSGKLFVDEGGHRDSLILEVMCPFSLLKKDNKENEIKKFVYVNELDIALWETFKIKRSLIVKEMFKINGKREWCREFLGAVIKLSIAVDGEALLFIHDFDGVGEFKIPFEDGLEAVEAFVGNSNFIPDFVKAKKAQIDSLNELNGKLGKYRIRE